MSDQKLNKKLAEFAGIEYVKHVVQVCGQMVERYEWHYPDGSYHHYSPDFPNDLNACFKWLVPKVIDIIMAEQECSSDLAYAILFKKWLQELELDIPHYAPTLCPTIEKLIDRGTK